MDIGGRKRFLKQMSITAIAWVTICGCDRGPERIPAPPWDPPAAAAKALEIYDADKDGKIAGAELDKVPSFRDSMETLDKNSDKGLDAEEITQRFQEFVDSRLGLSRQSCRVTLRKSPLRGAEIVFEPEPFIAEYVTKPARGVTQADGATNLLTDGETLGMKPGFYKVKIYQKDPSGKERIKPQYNEDTVLGIEVSPQNMKLRLAGIAFDLK